MVASCGGSPTSPTAGGSTTTIPTPPGANAPQCRTLYTGWTIASSPINPTPSANATASFNTITNELTVNILDASTTCTTNVYRYQSRADFIDEVSVIPPLNLLTSQTTTTVSACGGLPGSVLEVRYTYDVPQRRLTQVFFVQTGGSTTYTAWDSFGRPTTGTFSNGGSVTFVYDNAARTATQTQVFPGSTTVSTGFYDANGGLMRTVVNPGAQTTTYTPTATTTVCK